MIPGLVLGLGFGVGSLVVAMASSAGRSGTGSIGSRAGPATTVVGRSARNRCRPGGVDPARAGVLARSDVAPRGLRLGGGRPGVLPLLPTSATTWSTSGTLDDTQGTSRTMMRDCRVDKAKSEEVTL